MQMFGTTPPICNTYVWLERGKPKLFVFEGTEITERAGIEHGASSGKKVDKLSL